MKLYLIKTKVKPQLKYAEVFSFEEEFNRYKLSFKKKKYWATIEGFQLEFPNITFDDMKQCYYVYPKDSKENFKYYNIIDECDKQF